MQCNYIKAKDKAQCRANAMLDSEFCYLHNPSVSKQDKNAAQSKGGQANAISVKTPLQPFENKWGHDPLLSAQLKKTPFGVFWWTA